METIWNNTEREIATIGKAGPIETKEPVAMADVAEPLGPVGVRAGVQTEIAVAVAGGTAVTGAGDSVGEGDCRGRWPGWNQSR